MATAIIITRGCQAPWWENYQIILLSELGGVFQCYKCSLHYKTWQTAPSYRSVLLLVGCLLNSVWSTYKYEHLSSFWKSNSIQSRSHQQECCGTGVQMWFVNVFSKRFHSVLTKVCWTAPHSSRHSSCNLYEDPQVQTIQQIGDLFMFDFWFFDIKTWQMCFLLLLLRTRTSTETPPHSAHTWRRAQTYFSHSDRSISHVIYWRQHRFNFDDINILKRT